MPSAHIIPKHQNNMLLHVHISNTTKAIVFVAKSFFKTFCHKDNNLCCIRDVDMEKHVILVFG